MSPSQRAWEIHFGGPEAPPGRLRDLLAERVRAVPPGGAIDFVTYYFRDRRLAQELLDARRRGVEVRVTLDGHPRSARANDAVVALLAGPQGLGAGLRVVSRPGDGRAWGPLLRPRVHEKLYCFSQPRAAFVGSFNPSGDAPELAPDVVRAIGDQDRGHNTLVELRSEHAVAGLVRHARQLHGARLGPCDRFSRAANAALRDGDLEIHFWPRATRSPVLRLLSRLGPADRLRIVASHLSGPSALYTLRRLRRRGVELEILVGGTRRRVPPRGERSLAAAGIPVRRAQHPGLPMHDKFALVEGRGAPAERAAIFGSFNWSEPSRRLNREIGLISRDTGLFAAFEARWQQLSALAQGSEAPAAPR